MLLNVYRLYPCPHRAAIPLGEEVQRVKVKSEQANETVKYEFKHNLKFLRAINS